MSLLFTLLSLSLLSCNEQMKYLSELQESERMVQELAESRCIYMINNLLEQKQVCPNNITYFYSRPCVDQPLFFERYVEKMKRDGWKVSLSHQVFQVFEDFDKRGIQHPVCVKFPNDHRHSRVFKGCFASYDGSYDTTLPFIQIDRTKGSTFWFNRNIDLSTDTTFGVNLRYTLVVIKISPSLSKGLTCTISLILVPSLSYT